MEGGREGGKEGGYEAGNEERGGEVGRGQQREKLYFPNRFTRLVFWEGKAWKWGGWWRARADERRERESWARLPPPFFFGFLHMIKNSLF